MGECYWRPISIDLTGTGEGDDVGGGTPGGTYRVCLEASYGTITGGELRFAPAYWWKNVDVEEGGNVTFNFAPMLGYGNGTICVDEGDEVPLSGSSTYTVSNVTNDVNIRIDYVRTTTSKIINVRVTNGTSSGSVLVAPGGSTTVTFAPNPGASWSSGSWGTTTQQTWQYTGLAECSSKTFSSVTTDMVLVIAYTTQAELGEQAGNNDGWNDGYARVPSEYHYVGGESVEYKTAYETAYNLAYTNGLASADMSAGSAAGETDGYADGWNGVAKNYNRSAGHSATYISRYISSYDDNYSDGVEGNTYTSGHDSSEGYWDGYQDGAANTTTHHQNLTGATNWQGLVYSTEYVSGYEAAYTEGYAAGIPAEESSYTITVVVTNGTSSGSVQVTSGGSTTVTFAPNAGASWSSGKWATQANADLNNYTSFNECSSHAFTNVTTDMKLVIAYTPETPPVGGPYTITVVVTNGTSSGSVVAASGTTKTITFAPDNNDCEWYYGSKYAETAHPANWHGVPEGISYTFTNIQTNWTLTIIYTSAYDVGHEDGYWAGYDESQNEISEFYNALPTGKGADYIEGWKAGYDEGYASSDKEFGWAAGEPDGFVDGWNGVIPQDYSKSAGHSAAYIAGYIEYYSWSYTYGVASNCYSGGYDTGFADGSGNYHADLESPWEYGGISLYYNEQFKAGYEVGYTEGSGN